jgi:DNA polymerase III subunit delta'
MKPAPTLTPWTQPLAAALAADLARLGHALLLHGPAGLGKRDLALHLAMRLLCLTPGLDGAACGHCRSCHLFGVGNHPDFHPIAPAESGRSILVDQVRALGDFLHLRPHLAPRRLVVIAPADAMNINAANSLLKLLEEPPADSYLLLVSDRPARLPATVRSRCAQIAVRPPATAVALDWLARSGVAPEAAAVLLSLAGGAPLRARELAGADFLAGRETLLQDLEGLARGAGDPLACAGRWKALGAAPALTWLQGLLADLIRSRQAPGARLGNPDLGERLHDLQKQLNLNQLYRFFDTVSQSRNFLGGPLDELLLLEDVLIRWVRLTRLSPSHG